VGGFSQAFFVFVFVYIQGAVLKPEKFFAYRKRRPKRPPAGKIACHTKSQSPEAAFQPACTVENLPI